MEPGVDESVLTSDVPLSRWQALRERLALVLGKVSNWWSGVHLSEVFWPCISVVTAILLVVAMFQPMARFLVSAGGPVEVAEVHASVAPDATATSEPALNVEQILLDMDRRLVELEVRAGLPARVSYVAPALPSAAGRSDVPWLAAPASLPVSPAVPTAPALPVGAWGETDLDRSLFNFTPSDTFGALK